MLLSENAHIARGLACTCRQWYAWIQFLIIQWEFNGFLKPGQAFSRVLDQWILTIKPHNTWTPFHKKQYFFVTAGSRAWFKLSRVQSVNSPSNKNYAASWLGQLPILSCPKNGQRTVEFAVFGFGSVSSSAASTKQLVAERFRLKHDPRHRTNLKRKLTTHRLWKFRSIGIRFSRRVPQVLRLSQLHLPSVAFARRIWTELLGLRISIRQVVLVQCSQLTKGCHHME